MATLLLPVIAFLDQVLGGSLGGAILALSLAVRLALLPLTVRMARRARRNQERARAVQPELEALRRRLAKEPGRLHAETQELYRKHGFSPVDPAAVLGGLVQLPVFGLLYGAIKRALVANRAFLWVRSLSAPSLPLTLVVLALAALTAYAMPAASGEARAVMIALQVALTSFFVWKLAAGLTLYWVASGLVGLLQTVWLGRSPGAATARA